MPLDARRKYIHRKQYVVLVDEDTGSEVFLLTRTDALNLIQRMRKAAKKKDLPGVKPTRRVIIRGD